MDDNRYCNATLIYFKVEESWGQDKIQVYDWDMSQILDEHVRMLECMSSLQDQLDISVDT